MKTTTAIFLITCFFVAPIAASADMFESKNLVKTEAEPVKIEASNKIIFVDFGKAAFGTIRFQATAENNKQVVVVHLGEVLDKDKNRINRDPGGTRRYRAMNQPLKKGTHWYEVKIIPDARNTGERAILMPKDIGEVMPFRYCELENYPDELTKEKIRQIRVHYPFDDDASYFRSSDKVLNDVWEMCKYSIKATSVTGVYIDGDRERIPYEGDAYINQIAHYCLDSEYAMARRSLEYLMDNPTWPVEWHQHIPLMVWEEYMYTGDKGFLKKHYKAIVSKMLLPLQRADGLLSVTPQMASDPKFLKTIGMTKKIRTLVDWPKDERDNHQFKDEDSVVNAFLYRNLVLMARMAEVIGKKEDAEEFRIMSEKVYQSYQKVFFIQDKGIYRDGSGANHSSIHANLFPLAFGLVSEDKQKKVIAHIKSRGMACSVYAAQHLLDGLYKAGAEDYALSLLTSTKERSWAHMIYDVGSTISLEAWDDKFKPNQDWNHAWGAAPADLIPRRLMGIMPIEPGFKKARIQPQVGSLKEASIKHPTPLGPITLSIRRKGKKWDVEITIPKDMTAEFIQPWDKKSIQLKSGKHTLSFP